MWRLKHNDVQAGYVSNTANSVESEFNTDTVTDNGAVAQSWQSQNQYSEQDGLERQQHAGCFFKLTLRVTAYEWDEVNK